MSCTVGGSGYCPQLAFDASTNRLTKIGSTSTSFDASGDMTYDGTYNYTWDAEGRMSYASVGTWYQTSIYDALGQRVETIYPDGGTYTRAMSFPRDIFGRRTGIFDDRPSINWVGWDQFWARVAGERVLMGGSTSWARHGDAAGSTTMETDQTGAVAGDVGYYPWGETWQQTGTINVNAFGDLGFQVNNPQPPAMHRDLNPLLGRWLTPDPGGRNVVNLANPQTWNMYAYVTNNPASLNDPSGLAGQQGTVSTCIPNDNHCAAPIVSEIFTTANAQNQTLAQQQNQGQNQVQKSLNAMGMGGKGGRGGGQGKGERRHAGKPEGTPNPGKHARRLPDGRWEVKDPHTGKKVIKPPSWSPDAVKKAVKIGVAAGVAAAIQTLIETAPQWAPLIPLVP